MQTKGAIAAQPVVHDSQGASPFPRGPMDTCGYHVSGGPLPFLPSFAVLTDSFGSRIIENAPRAGLGAFTLAQADGFLSTATSRQRRDRLGRWAARRQSRREKESEVVPRNNVFTFRY
jgi:hypothetical protein